MTNTLHLLVLLKCFIACGLGAQNTHCKHLLDGVKSESLKGRLLGSGSGLWPVVTSICYGCVVFSHVVLVLLNNCFVFLFVILLCL